MEPRESHESDPILSPSSAPIVAAKSSPVSCPGQVCYERVLPSEAHYYQPPPPPACTGTAFIKNTTQISLEYYIYRSSPYSCILVVPDDPLCPLPLDAVGYISKLWKKNNLKVLFLIPHKDEDLIITWASEWSNYCAITFTKTTVLSESDIRIAFNDGEALHMNRNECINYQQKPLIIMSPLALEMMVCTCTITVCSCVFCL